MTTPYELSETVAVGAPEHEKMHSEIHRRVNLIGKILRTGTNIIPSLPQAGTFFLYDSATVGEMVIPTDSQVNFPIGTELGIAALNASVVLKASTSAADISFVAGSSFTSANQTGTVFDVPMPTGILDNDCIVMHVATATTSSAYSWTGPGDFTQHDAMIGPDGAGSLVYIKPLAVAADAGVTKPVTISGKTDGTPITATVGVWRNTHGTGLIEVSASSGINSTNITPSVTTVNDKAIHVITKNWAGTTAKTSGVIAPTGYTAAVASPFTNLSAANTSNGLAFSPTLNPAGTILAEQTWTNAGYGGTRSLVLRPAQVVSIKLISPDNATSWTIAKGSRGVAVKVGPNEWLVTV